MFTKHPNPSEYYIGLIAIAIPVGFMLQSLAIPFIIIGAGTMLASFLK